MRVLLAHNYYRQWGGADATVAFDAAILRARGHEVVEYSRRSGEIGRDVSRAAALVGAFGSRRTRREIRDLPGRFDVAHVHNWMPLLSPSVYGALRERGIPVVQTVNDYRMFCVNGLFYTAGEVCTRCPDSGSFLPSLSRRCHPEGLASTVLYATVLGGMRRRRTQLDGVTVFVAVSEFVRDRLLGAGVAPERIVVKGNLPPAIEAAPSSEPGGYGLYLGRLAREKGVRTLLKALAAAREFPFKIAGTGPEEAALRESARELPHVEFLGFVSGDARFDLLRKAAFTVCPSECHETFGISALESLAVGTPVIATRMGGLQGLVLPGETGDLVPAGDAGALSAAMIRLGRPGPEMRRAARRFYEERLSPARGGELLEEAYARAKELGARPGI